MTNRIACAICGAALHSEALYDEHAEDYFCDAVCYEDWADHTQNPIDYYARHNIKGVEL